MPHKLTTAVAAAVLTTGAAAVAGGSPASAHEAGEPHLVTDLNTTGAGAWFVDLHAIGADLYFVAETPDAGEELFFHDASTGATTLIDINPGRPGSTPRSLATGPDGWLYFAADDGVHGQELWRANGPTAELVRDIRPGPDGSWPAYLVAFAGAVSFAADDGTFNDIDAFGQELWRSDGTEGGTVPAPIDQSVTSVRDLAVYTGAVEDRLFFRGEGITTNAGPELWRYTASTATATEYDLVAGVSGSYPIGVTQVGSRLFVNAGQTLRRIDNPEGGPAWATLATVKGPSGMVASGTTLWLRATSLADPQQSTLWRVIGAGAPIEFVTVVNPAGIAMYQSTPLYSAVNANGREFWAQTSLYTDIVPGPDSSDPTSITPIPSGDRVVMWTNLNGLTELGWIAASGGVYPFHRYPGLDPLPIDQPALPLEPDPGSGGWWHVGNDRAHGVSVWHLSSDGATTTRVPTTDLLPGTAAR